MSNHRLEDIAIKADSYATHLSSVEGLKAALSMLADDLRAVIAARNAVQPVDVRGRK